MKKILITGSRSGLAKALIDKLICKDYYIYATTRTVSQSKSLKEIYKNYNNIECFKLDITNLNDLEKVKNLNIDILICNAAISNGGNLIEIDVDLVRENYEVNVFSNLKLIQICLKKMIKKEGKIIIISSLSGIIPISFIGSYSSSKASLIKISEILKKEIKMLNKKVKICLIEPGIYLTGFNKYMFSNKYGDKNSYFNKYEEKIKNKERLLLKILGKKDYNSILKKIIKCIEDKNPRFIYRAPFFQVIGAKIYSLFKQ